MLEKEWKEVVVEKAAMVSTAFQMDEMKDTKRDPQKE